MAESRYLASIKPYLKELLDKLLKEYEYASVLSTDCCGKLYSVGKNTTTLSDNSFKERGTVIRVYAQEAYTEYAFNNISSENIDSILEKVKNAVKISKNLMLKNEADKHPLIKEEKISFFKKADIKENPEEKGAEYITKKLAELKDEAVSLSDKIAEFQARYNFLNINKIFLSKAKDLEQSFTWSEGYLIAVTSDGINTKQTLKSYSGIKGAELIDEMKSGVRGVVEDGVKLLGAEKITPGEYDVICAPGITGLIAHEAFGHGVEMDMAVKDRAKSKYCMGEYVASPIVNMTDSASAVIDNGSFYFDDEGNIAGVTDIIVNGVLKAGMNDTLTALAMNEKPTGNGRREAYDHKAYTRMTNTFIKPGKDKKEDMIKSIKYGVLLETYSSGMEDPKNWGIQCMIEIGKEIKDGKLTGKIFSPILMTGYVPDLLKSIDMISDDFVTSGSGYCGKGYKEFAKVSCGGPYIKCRARLG